MKKILFSTLLAVTYLVNGQTCVPGIITSGPNALGTGGGYDTYHQTCLSYNSDLNAVLWIHRASPKWNFSGRTNGAIQATWLNVASNTWDSMIIYRDSAALHSARYPGGTFYNPAGNSTIANAFVVGSGPTVGAGSWDGTWYSSRQPSGNYHSVDSSLDDNNVSLFGTAPFGNAFNSNNTSSFLNCDMQMAGNNVVVGGGLVDQTYTLTSGSGIHGGTIGKFNGSVWSVDSIIPGFYSSSITGYATDGEGMRLAFSPNGQTGYAVMIGRLATNFNNSADSSLSPIVYKTTNGGSTWFPILQGYDWSAMHPELKKNIGFVTNANGMNHFRINPRHGYDVTVDSAGTLHLVASLTSVYQDGLQVDSLTYFYTYDYDYMNHHPIIWDLMTDGSSWNTLLIDSVNTSYVAADPSMDSTASFNAWTNGSGSYLAYGARIQVSRSVNGGKIFYSWADSDPTLTGNQFNGQPDLHLKSYDPAQQKVTSAINLTYGASVCYFHFMSDVSYYDNGQGKWVCPLVYTTGESVISPGIYDGISTVDYNYVNCGSFSNTQYVYPAVLNTATPGCSPSVTFVMHQDSANPQPGIWEVSAYYSPQVTSAVWYWGDGTSTAGLTPGHTYSSAGQYNICVTAFAACGDSASTCQNDSLYKMNAANLPNSVISVTVLNENGVGIKTNTAAVEQVSIYPNPSQGMIRLQMQNAGVSAKAEVYITNVLGEVIYSSKEAMRSSSLDKEIDLQGMSSGTYFVRVVMGSKIYNDKFVISR